MSRKNSPPFLSERRRMVACIQPNLSSGEAVGWPRIPDRPGSWRFVLDGFMTPWSFDAFGSGSYASRRVGFSGPTMVLSETRGLQLFWVMRGGIRSYKRGCQEKILPLSSPRGDGWWPASSRISVLERLWAGRVFRTDRAVGGLYSTVS